jgi:hypothetical protein
MHFQAVFRLVISQTHLLERTGLVQVGDCVEIEAQVAEGSCVREAF